MTPLAATDKLFFERADAALDRAAAEASLGSALAEQRRRRALSGIPRERADQPRRRPHPQRRVRHHAGLRPARGGRRGHRLRPCRRTVRARAATRAASSVAAVAAGHSGVAAEPPRATNARLYSDANPLGADRVSCPHRTAGRDRRLCARQGSARRAGDGLDRRRMAGGADHARRRHAGRRPPAAGAAQCLGGGGAGRPARDRQLRHRRPLRLRPRHRARRCGAARSTRRCARRWSTWTAVPAPAGEMEVVLGPGWPGILLHEAIGHGLEGDFNRKKTSAFAGLLGQADRRRRASPWSTTARSPTGAAA